jgi:hypothetical protein
LEPIIPDGSPREPRSGAGTTRLEADIEFVPVMIKSRSDGRQTRVDGDAALRTRQAANTAARDNPNILAWRSVDVLLDELSAADKRELLPGLSAKSPAGIPSGSSLV